MRASDRDREEALALLRARCAEGYLSIETFERRVEQTFAARSVAELRALVDDVTGGGSRLERSVSRFRRARSAGDDAVPVALPLDGPIVVGRSGCDVVLSEPTVSRRHLELRPAGPGQWLAVDVGSLNGTWRANRRVRRTIVVRGDELWLGSCAVRLD
jgi:pSer/pThr/pTyr-binding forkhead associated (FHA) protein